MLPTPILSDLETATWLLRDGDGNIRAALICWGVVLSTFLILRIPREALLGCLIVAGATVGLAAAVVDMTEQATASPRAAEIPALRGQATSPARSSAEYPPEFRRPY
jgi:hypothetical protein